MQQSCEQCGHSISNSQKFCMHCGTRITLDTPGNSSENIYVQGNIQGNVQGGRVGFTQAVSRGFRLAFVTTGRASRAEFWWFYLFSIPGFYGLMIIFGTLAAVSDSIAILGIGYVAGIFMFSIPQLALSSRRLHDTGRSG